MAHDMSGDRYNNISMKLWQHINHFRHNHTTSFYAPEMRPGKFVTLAVEYYTQIPYINRNQADREQNNMVRDYARHPRIQAVSSPKRTLGRYQYSTVEARKSSRWQTRSTFLAGRALLGRNFLWGIGRKGTTRVRGCSLGKVFVCPEL